MGKISGYPGYYDADFPIKGAKHILVVVRDCQYCPDYATFMQMLLNKES